MEVLGPACQVSRRVPRPRQSHAARAVGAEVEALYTNGPAGGGGAWANDREVFAVASCLIERDVIETRTIWVKS